MTQLNGEVAEGQSPKDDFENFDKPNFEAPEFENLDSSTPITAGEIEGQNSSQTSGSIFDGDVRTQMFNYASGLRQRSWIKTIRSPLRFISTGNFSRPQSRTQIMSRVPLNLKFYMTNYILLAVLIMSYSILSSVSLLFLIAAFAWLWIWAMKQDEFRVGPVVVTERMKILVLTALTGLVFVWAAGSTLIWSMGISVALISIHALFHSSVDATDVEGGEFSILPTTMSDLP